MKELKLSLGYLAALSAVIAITSTEAATTELLGDLSVTNGTDQNNNYIPQNAVWFEGVLGEGMLPLSLQGEGTRMFWYPGKAAFRGGRLSGTWSDGWGAGNIGHYSFSWGLNNEASGSNAAVFGSYGIASSPNSFSAGDETWATAHAAASFGTWSYSSGDSSVSAGFNAGAGDFAATAFGDTTYASGWASLAANLWTIASGSGATALGKDTAAAGNLSFAAGQNTRAESYAEFIIGQWNNPSTGNATSWNAADPVFVIGNGNGISGDPDQRRNAMVVRKNGDTEINGALKVAGPIRIPEAGDLAMGAFQAQP